MIPLLVTGIPTDYIELCAETPAECVMLARIGTSKLLRAPERVFLDLEKDDTIRLRVHVSDASPGVVHVVPGGVAGADHENTAKLMGQK
jgi:hypothetical protein